MTSIRPIAFALALLGSPALANDGTQQYQNDHTEMTQAITRAVEALPLFLKNTVGDDGVSLNGAALKVSFDVNDTGTEQEVIWIAPFMLLDGTHAMGLLANAPVSLTGKAEGDPIEFTVNRIMDWSYQGPDAKLYGNYTSRIQLQALPADYDWLRNALAPDPVPAAWK
ncbi:MAG: DUF2314 domain-containing protein [Pseudomonadota bacterium]